MSTLKTDILKDVAETVSVNVTDLPSAVTLRQDLADLTKGAELVAFDEAKIYPANTVGSAIVAASLGKMASITDYEANVVTKPNPLDPDTWDWTPAVVAAFTDLAPVGKLEFPEGVFKFSGVSTSSTISLVGRGAGNTTIQNFTAGATILTYDQVGVSDKERRNWLTFEGITVRDEVSFTGSGIVTNNVLSIVLRDCYIRDFQTGYGLQILEALWVYLENTNSDLCELNFVSTLVPHFNNVICIHGGEIRNPPAGKFGLYVEGGDVISLRDATIEGTGGGAMTAGGKFKNIKLLTLDNTYFEVLNTATEAGLSLDNCQAVSIGRCQLNSQSTSVPSVLLAGCDAVSFEQTALVAFPIRTTGINSVTFDGCMVEGPMDISADTSFKVLSPMPYNTRAVIVTDPAMQLRRLGKPKAFRNTYADSAFETAAPGVTVVAGAPVSSQDTTQGYFGTTSWRVTGVAGDTIRANNLGETAANGQSGCFSFMAKADTAGRFTLLNFLSGAAGGHDIYLSTEWRRYFTITTLDPTSVAGDDFLLQLAFQGTNAFNITDIQFIPFTDYSEIPGIIDGFNYLPTHGATIPGALSKTVFPEHVTFDRSINLRTLPIFADNAAATAGGVVAGDLYRTAVGAVHIRF